jgi:hypothetical protein
MRTNFAVQDIQIAQRRGNGRIPGHCGEYVIIRPVAKIQRIPVYALRFCYVVKFPIESLSGEVLENFPEKTARPNALPGARRHGSWRAPSRAQSALSAGMTP